MESLLPFWLNRSPAFWDVARTLAKHHHTPQTPGREKWSVRDKRKSLGFQKSSLKEPFRPSYFLRFGTRCDGWNYSGHVVTMRES